MTEQCEPLVCKLFLRLEKKIEDSSIPAVPEKGKRPPRPKPLPPSDTLFINCPCRDTLVCTNPKRKREG